MYKIQLTPGAADFIRGQNHKVQRQLTNNLDDTNSITFDCNDYDKVGNRLSMKIDDANAHVYTYDVLYQLTNVDYNDGNTTAYTYDSLGNRTSVVNGGTTSYSRNSLNQYTSVGGTTYSYDDNGNLTDDGTYEYYYDCENRLTDVNESGSNVATYTYDYLGRRTSKTVDGNTIKYCYDGGSVIAEYDGNGTALRRYFYGPGIDEPICMKRFPAAGTTAWFYYHLDPLGSVAGISDANGMLVERYEYDVYGKPTIYDTNDTVLTESSVGNPYMFTGRRYDTETGLYYYRARYYDPNIGRFLQPDPIGYKAGLNLYTYVGNNPINRKDPRGLFSDIICCTGRQKSMLQEDEELAQDQIIDLSIDIFEAIFADAGQYPWFTNWKLNNSYATVTAASNKLEQGKAKCEKRCSEGTRAWAWPLGNTVHICPPYWGHYPARRASILVHEGTHLGAATTDAAYFSGRNDPPHDVLIIGWDIIASTYDWWIINGFCIPGRNCPK